MTGRLLAASLCALLWAGTANGGNPPAAPAGCLQQYTSAGHVVGFDSGGYYVSNGAYGLRVTFEQAQAAAPTADAASDADGTGAGKAAPLRRVSYSNLWLGISVAYDAPQNGIARSTWALEPGADPAAIRLRYNRTVRQTESGGLSLVFDSGSISESRPVAWQDIDGHRQPVEVAFAIQADDVVGFHVGAYRSDLPLTIDPTITWNTSLGTSGVDYAHGIAVDGRGSVYVAGASDSTWGSPVRPYTVGSEGYRDAFVAQLTADGTLVWNTFLGGSGDDAGYAVAIDGSGNVDVAGWSSGTWGSPVRSYTASPPSLVGYDAFVAQLTTDGALVWNTFLGGNGDDFGNGIAVDSSGNIYVAGSSDVATLGGAWGSPVRAYTWFNDAFAAKLTASGALVWNTFLGGNGDDVGNGIALDSSGNIYVVGTSASVSYTSGTWGNPVRAYTAGADGFVAKLTTAGALLWNTFIGGSGDDYGNGIALDSSGNIDVVGDSSATWGSPVSAYTAGYDALADSADSGRSAGLEHLSWGQRRRLWLQHCRR